MRINARPEFVVKRFALPLALRLGALAFLLLAMARNVEGAGITLVQHASKDGGTTTSSTLAFASNNTAGNWIGVVIRAGALNETISVSDSRGNSYKKALQFNQTVDGFTFAIFYAENISTGTNSITVSDSISGTLRFAIYEYSGIATANSLDVTAAAQGRSTSPSTAPSVNTTVSGDLLLGAFMTGNGQNFTAGSGYKIEDNVPSAQSSKLMVEDQIQASVGATTANATMGSTDDWAAGFAAFKPAGGTGGTAPTITNLNPNSGGVGTPVVITGTNFGATQAQGSSTVKFNGVTSPPSAWNATSITAPVPAGATTGSVIVTVSGVASNGASFTVIPPPTVTINQAAGQADPTNGSTINFSVAFSAAVTGFSNSGVTLSGTAGATTAIVTGTGTTYNVAVSGMTQTGTVIATIPAGVASANGVSNTASTSTDNTVTYDITPPSVTVNQAASQPDPASSSPINFTAVFSKTVTGFSNTGVTLGGTAGATTAVVTGSGTTYNIAVSGMTQTGTVTASIPAGKATDSAGNLNTASTSTDNTVTYNVAAPSVTINQAAGQADPTNGSTINFTVVFSTAVTGFVNSDVNLSGTAGATTATVTGSGTTYNVAVSGMTQTGTVIATIPAGAASANGVQNTASTSTDNTVTYDITPPSVTVNQAASQADPTGNSPVNFTAVFSKSVTGFSNAGVTLNGTAGATTTVVTGSGTTYNIAVSGMTQTGTVIASIPAGRAADSAGNLNTASTSTDNTVTYNFTALVGPVAAYSFEEGTGTTTADSSGNNNNGTLSAGVTWTAGKSGNAVAFNVTSGDITVPDSNSLDLSGSYTISAWVKPTTVSGTQTLLIKEVTSGCSYFVQIVNGQIDSGFNNGSGCIEHITSNANLAAGNWYYLTVVLDHSSNTYNTYLNGVLISSVAESGVPLPNNQALLMGRSACSSCGFERLNGVLDEVRIYNRAQSASEIQSIYNSYIGGPTITSLNPNSGAVGTPVIITGTNFGATQAQGNSTVKFNGVQATPTVWSGTSITAPVPTGATTGNVVVTVNGVASTGVLFTVPSSAPSVTINQAASQSDPTSTSPINFTAVFSTAVTGFSNSGVTLSGTAGATTAVVTGSGATYNVAVSGMTQSGTVIATIPAGVATANGVSNTASTSTDNTVTFSSGTLPGPVAAYSFEEGTGTTTADSSGNNNTGTLSAGVTWTAGKSGNAVAFNGTSGDITINDSNSLDLNGSFTISAWVKPSTVAGTGTVLIKENTSGCGYFVQIVNGQIDSGFNNGSGCIEHITSTANLTANNWYYVTAVLDHSTNTYYTYVNGTLLSSASETGVPVPNTQPLVLGRSGCSSCGFERLNGVLDEVRIYSRAQSASEIQSIYNSNVVAPTITGLNPASGTTGTPVTISGTNFGGSQGASTVKFNGVTASPTAWSDTSITVPVPAGATTGSVVVTVNGNASSGVPFTVTNLFVTISPKRSAVTLTQPQQFAATVSNDPANGGVSWFVDGALSGDATVGTVSGTGLYTPGTEPGVHSVTATSNSNTSASATATVAVTDLAGVFTNHNDNARTGQNLQEYALNASNVNSATFGALFTCPVDGYLYAQPLYVANLNIGGQTRNVVVIATEHDSVYVFDADSPSCVQLWKTSFLSSGVTTVAPADVSELVDLTPEIGITSTPVIDPASHTVYVFAKTKETVGIGCSTVAPCFVHKLHALDLLTGTEKLGGPVVFTAPNFDPLIHLQRPALLLNNGTVYVAIGSHGDHGSWQGWMAAFDATTLAQKWVYHATDPTTLNNGGGIWLSGNGPSVDANGNIYVQSGNGNFDGVKNFADSVLKVSPNGTQLDYFTPFNQQILETNDIDLGSANTVVLPDSVGSAAHPHLVVAVGKPGVIYLLDQNNMGQFNAAADQVVGEVAVTFNTTNFVGGFFGQPVYWNGNIYAVAVGDALRQFSIANATISPTSLSQSPNIYPFRAGTPALSANGTTNGIVWMVDVGAYNSNGAAILYAYDATNLGNLLFSSPSSGAGAAPLTAKFTVPTVANGKVYVGGRNAFTVFGLLPN